MIGTTIMAKMTILGAADCEEPAVVQLEAMKVSDRRGNHAFCSPHLSH
jgi:hypothetical protein